MSGQANETDRALALVREILAAILNVSPTVIRPEDRLIQDLRLDTDDFSFWFVPKIEERLGVRIPVEAWDTVETVVDAAHVVWSARPPSN